MNKKPKREREKQIVQECSHCFLIVNEEGKMHGENDSELRRVAG